MQLNERLEVRLKKTTKENLKKVAKKQFRKPSEMARIIIEKAVDKK